jgi:uncharacterized membrane protein YbhN (UPF0104 family)
MAKVASALARAMHERIGWGQIGIAISVVIVAIAATTLFRLFHTIDLGKVVSALRAYPIDRILISGVFVAAAYVALTLYDLFALRAIGRDVVPYRIAAFAGFTSYTIGHNVGATVFTCGVIRYRVYSAWGLGVADIAKIAFVTGLTYWLGNAFLLGSGLSLAPAAASAIDQLPSWANRMIGLGALSAIAAYLVWLSRRPRFIGRSNWRLVLPSPRATVVQIAIGTLDLVCVALAMYTLLPTHPAIDFVTFLVIFVSSMLLGVISYAPGSLGVIEAAMFVGLREFQKEELLASLLIFRALYFVLPLFVGASLLALHELWSMMRPAIGPLVPKPKNPAESHRPV